jgi:hypothetical protein
LSKDKFDPSKGLPLYPEAVWEIWRTARNQTAKVTGFDEDNAGVADKMAQALILYGHLATAAAYIRRGLGYSEVPETILDTVSEGATRVGSAMFDAAKQSLEDEDRNPTIH